MTHLRGVVVAGLGLLSVLSGPGTVALHAADPLRVVLLVDSSSAMTTMITEFRSGLNAFIDDLPVGAELAMISTGGQFRMRLAPTLDHQRMHEAAARFASDGGANSLLDTLLESDRRLLKSAPNRRPLLVVLTTDQPSRAEPPIYEYNQFVHDFVRRQGRAHAIVIRGTQTGLTFDLMANLTTNTDGLFLPLVVANSLATRMREVAAQVAAQE